MSFLKLLAIFVVIFLQDSTIYVKEMGCNLTAEYSSAVKLQLREFSLFIALQETANRSSSELSNPLLRRLIDNLKCF